jgi:hypothetical protein
MWRWAEAEDLRIANVEVDDRPARLLAFLCEASQVSDGVLKTSSSV